MKPIINPLYFYLIDVCDNIRLVLSIVTIIIMVVLGIVLGIVFSIGYLDGDEELLDKIKSNRMCKTGIIICIICSIISAIIPSKETCYQMMVANCITPNNIEMAENNMKDLVDYIIDSVDSLNGDKDGDKNEE